MVGAFGHTPRMARDTGFPTSDAQDDFLRARRRQVLSRLGELVGASNSMPDGRPSRASAASSKSSGLMPTSTSRPSATPAGYRAQAPAAATSARAGMVSDPSAAMNGASSASTASRSS